MSADGLLPKALARIHPRFKTPYVAILLEGAIALALSLFTGISQLISFAVFNLGVCYLLVCLVARGPEEERREGPSRDRAFSPGLARSSASTSSTRRPSSTSSLGSVFVLLGVPVYLFFSKTTARELEGRIVSEEEVFGRELQRQHAFLANFVRIARALCKRLARRPKA